MKNNIINHIKPFAVITSLLVLSFNTYGQKKKHEFSIAVGGSTSFIDYDLKNGEQLNKDGNNFGIRYAHYLNKNWSLSLGAEYQTYQSSANFSSLKENYTTTDSDGDSFDFRYMATNFTENQKLAYVNIPITVQFETSGKTKFYALAGAKIGFNVKGEYQTSIENLTTSGYYPQYNVELFAPYFAGFGSYDNIKSEKGKLTTDISYSAIIESGLKQTLGKKTSIYAGLYLDYGLNSISDKKEKSNLIQYPAEIPVDFKYKSVFDSPYVSNAKLISYGFKIRLAFDAYSSTKN